MWQLTKSVLLRTHYCNITFGQCENYFTVEIANPSLGPLPVTEKQKIYLYRKFELDNPKMKTTAILSKVVEALGKNFEH